MESVQFFLLLLDNINIYALVFFILLIPYIFIIKSVYISIVDPFILSLVYSFFSSTVVFFLYFTDSITSFYFTQFLFSQVAFFLGFFVFKTLNLRDMNVKPREYDSSAYRSQTLFIFYILLFLYLLVQIVIYTKFGIPLFNSGSRLATFSSGGGWGILRRFSTVYSFGALFFSFYVINKYNSRIHKRVAIVLLVFVFINAILSGSKASILFVFIVYFYYLIIFEPYNINKIRRYDFKIIIVGAFFAILILSVRSADSELPGYVLFFRRLIASGDVFWQGYNDNTLESIQGNAFTIIFCDFLATFRIVPWSELPRPLGMQIFESVYGVDLSIGPNARHNYLGFVCFGFFGSCFFSFILGLIVSYVRNKLYFKMGGKGCLLVFLYIILLRSVIDFETDMTIGLNLINSSIISIGFLSVVAVVTTFFIYFISKLFSKNKRW